MKMERRDLRGAVGGGYRNCYRFGGGHYDHHHHSENGIIDPLDGDVYDDVGVDDDDQSQVVPRVVTYLSSSSVASNGANYIEHHVSKMDTLAGVAIKYGVEVADIKKMNSLVTDLQMFALKTLHIPLPGRHPPSPCLSNGSESPGQSSHDRTPRSCGYPDLLDSFQSLKINTLQRKVSPAMSTLQGFYGLKSTEHKRNQSEGFEMAVYRKEDGPFPKQLITTTNPPLNRHRKSRSVANGFFKENGDIADEVESAIDDSSKWIDNNMLQSGRRPNKYGYKTPEILLKEDPSNNSGGFSAVKGKGLALRSKATSRTCLVAEDEVNGTNYTPASSGTNAVTNHHSGVRKSLSTPSLQDQESFTSSMWLGSKWNLKTDLQALSAAAIARPIFDGLPKPGRKNKAALD